MDSEPVKRRPERIALVSLLMFSTASVLFAISAMGPWILLYVWIASQAAQIVFACCAIRAKGKDGTSRRLGSLVASGIASIFPVTTLVLFICVFVIGGSSNVAQLAGPSGYGLWELWYHFWPFLFFGNPVAFFVSIVIAILAPYPPKYWASFTSRLCACIVAGFSWYIVVTYFPDA